MAGEVSVRLLALPVPGPVVGMCLLLLWLLARGEVLPSVDTAAGALLAHLSLLFVPAGVGLMAHFTRLGSEWMPLLVALVASTLIGMVTTALVMQWLMKGRVRRGDEHD
ncbi:CidA/LrgA family protein [Aestuariirhabdus litorea]|uniref:CidA/LrgA family protein n=1 Tax=Aestuariirhabdus litorea TaxID=2528527 RepID=UPI0024363EAC|nr:CidA/LrgA family protein [Aestuariirhabdus litorea]